MALHDQEKTEAPTPRRRDEARKEGRVPRSAELTTSFVLLGAAILLNVAGPSLGAQFPCCDPSACGHSPCSAYGADR